MSVPGDAFGWLELWGALGFGAGSVIGHILLLALALLLCYAGIRFQKAWMFFAGVMGGYSLGNWLGTVYTDQGAVNLTFVGVLSLVFALLGIALVIKFGRAGLFMFGAYMTYPIWRSLMPGGSLLWREMLALLPAAAVGAVCVKYSGRAFMAVAAVTGGMAAARQIIIIIPGLDSRSLELLAGAALAVTGMIVQLKRAEKRTEEQKAAEEKGGGP